MKYKSIGIFGNTRVRKCFESKRRQDYGKSHLGPVPQQNSSRAMEDEDAPVNRFKHGRAATFQKQVAPQEMKGDEANPDRKRCFVML